MDLNDLPLDRLTEQKAKRRRGGAGGGANGVGGSYPVGDSARTSNIACSVDAGRESGMSAPRRTRDRNVMSSKPLQTHSHQDENEGGPSSFANSGQFHGYLYALLYIIFSIYSPFSSF